MNAAVDAGLVLAQFIRAAEAVNLGTVPVSAVRNYSRETSDLLSLPEGVFPIAGLCLGYPSRVGALSRACHSTPRCIQIVSLMLTYAPKSTNTISAAKRCFRFASNGMPRITPMLNSTAGLKIKQGTTQCPSAPILVSIFARKNLV